MKTLLKDGLICLVVFVLVLIIVTRFDPIKNTEKINDVYFSYFEDRTGEMSLADVVNAASQEKFIEEADGNFFFGKSNSAFWIRILPGSNSKLKEYLSIYSPIVQDVRLYIGDKIYYSGWENILVNDGEELTYPVFPIGRYSQDDIKDYPVYLRIKSRYIHNYEIYFYNRHEFNFIHNINIGTNSFLLGMVITIFITSMIVFLRFNNKLYFWFAFSVLFLGMYTGCMVGIYNLFPSKLSGVLMSLSIEISLLFEIFILCFFIEISDVKLFHRTYFRYLICLITGSIIIFILCFVDRVIANKFSYLYFIAVILSCLYIGQRIYLAGYTNLRLFLAGWDCLSFVCVVSLVRSEGFLFSSFVVTKTYFLVAVAAYLLFSFGVAEHAGRIIVHNKEIQEQYKQAYEKIQNAEIALLQTQIKPHFLYNTLTSIERLCDVDAKKAKCAVADFADYLRNNVDFSAETGLISIEKEIENVKHYLSLEKIRFEERLQVVYNINAGNFMLPPLVVQPLVENAVRHGVTKKLDGGTIVITVSETEADYVISVMDNGVGFDTEQLFSNEGIHIGIRNAQSRLYRQSKGILSITSQIDIGTTAVITIPKR